MTRHPATERRSETTTTFDWNAQPNPPGGRAVTRWVFFLLLADLGTVGGLAGQIAYLSAQTDPVDRLLTGSPAANTAGGLGTILGVIVALMYALWPIGALRNRAPDELRAFRFLCWALLAGHPFLVAGLAVDYAIHGRDAIGFVFLTAPISLLLTPALWPVARALFAADWLSLSTPRGVWDAPARALPVTYQPTPAWMAFALPFVPAFRAGSNGLAVLALLLWLGALLMLFVAPLRAIVPFAIASGIGWRTDMRASLGVSPPGERAAAPPRLADQGRIAVMGKLCTPILFELDAMAAITLLALTRSSTAEAFLGIVQGSTIILFVALPFTLGPLMVANGLRRRGAELARRVAAIGLALAHVAMTALLAAVSFRISVLSHDILIGDPGYALLSPLIWALLGTLPLAGLLAMSALGFSSWSQRAE